MMKRPNDMWQPLMAAILSLSGMALLFVALFIPPGGRIDSSVLVAYGEVSAFAGALIGIDYKYRKENRP